METEKIERAKRILGFIAFLAILLTLLNCFFSARPIKKINANSKKALRIDYLMDFRLLDNEHSRQGYAAI